MFYFFFIVRFIVPSLCYTEWEDLQRKIKKRRSQGGGSMNSISHKDMSLTSIPLLFSVATHFPRQNLKCHLLSQLFPYSSQERWWRNSKSKYHPLKYRGFFQSFIYPQGPLGGSKWKETRNKSYWVYKHYKSISLLFNPLGDRDENDHKTSGRLCAYFRKEKERKKLWHFLELWFWKE